MFERYTERARRVMADISDHRFEVIGDCGHVVQEERAAQAGALIREYVDEVRNRPAPISTRPRAAAKKSKADTAG